MKFLHTADVHLDASMQAGMTQNQAKERRRELYDILENIADIAVKEGAEAILIAGDLFDTVSPSPEAVRRVSQVIAEYAPLDFILLCGNHDGTARVHLPPQPNLKIFAGGQTVFRYGNVAIYGAENPLVTPEELGIDEHDCNIVLLHGEVRDGGIEVQKWQNKGVDYLALGHYHRYDSQTIDHRGSYVYAGCPAGRGFDECGQKGFVMLTEENGRLTHEFIPLPGRQFHTVKVDVSSATSLFEMQKEMLDATKDIDPNDGVKVELIGEVSPACLPDKATLQAKLSKEFWYARIKDSTTLALASDLAYDTSLRGTFMRCVMIGETDRDRRERILSCGLKALRGEAIDE